MVEDHCETCNGWGDTGPPDFYCENCNGTGYADNTQSRKRVDRDNERYAKENCSDCGGRGCWECS